MTNKSKLKIYHTSAENEILVPLVDSSVHAGFPSPADDFVEMKISLDKELIRNKEAIF